MKKLGVGLGIRIRIMRSLSKWATLPKKTGSNTLISQDSGVRKIPYPISSNHGNTSNATHLKRLPTIPSILAKLAKQNQAQDISLELGSESEKIERDFDFKKNS